MIYVQRRDNGQRRWTMMSFWPIYSTLTTKSPPPGSPSLLSCALAMNADAPSVSTVSMIFVFIFFLSLLLFVLPNLRAHFTPGNLK
ncbi:MAG TPA: hypothetical protein VK840_00495 [Candidatus Dormibacteraeota bacterium]|nr:hypothetical protein [Candidatus Dormibacteraeota bacterium]